MSKFFLIGDSHARGLGGYSHHLFNSSLSSLDMSHYAKDGQSAYTLEYDKLDMGSLSVGRTSLVFFGECDIRKYLPKYDNAAYVAEMYVNDTYGYFGKDVLFLEPTPQAIDEIQVPYNDLDGNPVKEYEFGERIHQQSLFFEALNRYSNGNVISIKDIIDTDRLTSEHTDDGCHLNKKYLKIVIDHLEKL